MAHRSRRKASLGAAVIRITAVAAVILAAAVWWISRPPPAPAPATREGAATGAQTEPRGESTDRGPAASFMTEMARRPAASVLIAPEEEIPEEWEPALYEALVAGSSGAGAGDHRPLMELVMRTAVAAPRVQQEALRHLAFRLPTAGREAFLEVVLAPTVPENLRVEFLEQIVEVRRPELTEWLCQQVVDRTHEPALSAAARAGLERQTRAAAGGE